MPNPIYLPQRQNPWAGFGPNLLQQIVMAKISQNMKLKQMDAETKRAQAMKPPDREGFDTAWLNGEWKYLAQKEKKYDTLKNKEGELYYQEKGKPIPEGSEIPYKNTQPKTKRVYNNQLKRWEWKTESQIQENPALYGMSYSDKERLNRSSAPKIVSHTEQRQRMTKAQQDELKILEDPNSKEAGIATRSFQQYSNTPYTYRSTTKPSFWGSWGSPTESVEKVALPKLNGRQVTSKDVYEYSKDEKISYDEALDRILNMGK